MGTFGPAGTGARRGGRLPAIEKVVLRCNGWEIGGWKQVSLSGGIDGACTSFDLSLSERWVEAGTPPRLVDVPIEPGMPVEILAGGERVLEGYIDRLSRTVADGSHMVEVSGRSRTGDLMDARLEQGLNLRQISLRDCVAQLIAPFGISLTLGPSAETAVAEIIPVFHAKSGEPVLEEIKRLCFRRGLLVTDGPGGDLVLMRAGVYGEAIDLDPKEDVILAGSVSRDYSGLHSKVIVHGRGFSAAAASSADLALVQGVAQNPKVTRYRPLVTQASGGTGDASPQQEAELVIAREQAQSLSVSLRLAGWRRPDGRLWWKGQKIRLAEPRLAHDGDLVVRQCSLSLGEGGSVTTLSLAPPEPLDLPRGTAAEDMEDVQPKE